VAGYHLLAIAPMAISANYSWRYFFTSLSLSFWVVYGLRLAQAGRREAIEKRGWPQAMTTVTTTQRAATEVQTMDSPLLLLISDRL